MLVKGTIGLGIRERKPAADTQRYQEKVLAEWVSNLPKGNIGETSRLVYQLLLDSNQQLLTIQQRAEILKQLHASVAFITTALKKHYIGQSVSLSEKQQKVSNFSQAIEVEMAIASKTIIEDLLVDEKFDSPLLCIAINTCLFYFYHIQIRSYQLYREIPKAMWNELHILYQLAEQNQFHEKKLSIGENSVSIKNTYKMILLLATTNPNQLRQKEITQVSENLSAISRQIKLNSDPSEEHSFVVNLHSDAGPFHASLLKEPLKAHFRGFNLTDTVEFLKEELRNKPIDQRTMKLDDQTYRNLLSSWGLMASRSFTRKTSKGAIQVSIGLAASHFLIERELFGEEMPEVELTGEKLVDSLEGSLKNAIVVGVEDDDYYNKPQTSVPDWKKNPNESSNTDESMWDSMYRTKESRTQINANKPYEFMELAKDENLNQYQFKAAAIINISPGGFCLKMDGSLPKQTQTGEIIGLLDSKNPDDVSWNIGCIRWMGRAASGELNMGIQLIAPNAKPVKGQLRTSHSDDNNYQRCLLLPAIAGIGQPETILTSPMPFRKGSKVRLNIQGELQDIHLQDAVMNGHSFKQFTFNYLEMPKEAPVNKDDPNDFEGIWDII